MSRYSFSFRTSTFSTPSISLNPLSLRFIFSLGFLWSEMNTSLLLPHLLQNKFFLSFSCFRLLSNRARSGKGIKKRERERGVTVSRVQKEQNQRREREKSESLISSGSILEPKDVSSFLVHHPPTTNGSTCVYNCHTHSEWQRIDGGNEEETNLKIGDKIFSCPILHFFPLLNPFCSVLNPILFSSESDSLPKCTLSDLWIRKKGQNKLGEPNHEQKGERTECVRVQDSWEIVIGIIDECRDAFLRKTRTKRAGPCATHSLHISGVKEREVHNFSRKMDTDFMEIIHTGHSYRQRWRWQWFLFKENRPRNHILTWLYLSVLFFVPLFFAINSFAFFLSSWLFYCQEESNCFRKNQQERTKCSIFCSLLLFLSFRFIPFTLNFDFTFWVSLSLFGSRFWNFCSQPMYRTHILSLPISALLSPLLTRGWP